MTGDGGFTNPHRAVAIDPRMAFAKGLRGYQQDPDYLARRNKRMILKKQRNNSLAGASILSTSLAADEPVQAMPGRLKSSADIMERHVSLDKAARNRGNGDSGDGFGGGMAQALSHLEMRTLNDRKGTQ